MSDRRLNKANPLASPKPLFNVCDFLRRTYLEYVIPLFPADAPTKVLEMANPYVFAYPDKTSGVFASGYGRDMAWLENEAKWPKWTAAQRKLWLDIVGRNFMIGKIILQEDAKGPMIMQGTFDFEPKVIELAKAVSGAKDQVVELKERMQDARKSAGLKG